jgi:hypothetical protein
MGLSMEQLRQYISERVGKGFLQMSLLLLTQQHNKKWYFVGDMLYLPMDKKKTDGITYGFPVGDMTNKIFFWRTLSVCKSIGMFITNILTNKL